METLVYRVWEKNWRIYKAIWKRFVFQGDKQDAFFKAEHVDKYVLKSYLL